MGFMKLLGTSHAFGRILDRPSRYRLTQQSLLPKFGVEKRLGSDTGPDLKCLPFARTSKAEDSGVAPPAIKKMGPLSKIFRRGKKKIMNTVEADPSMASASAPSKPEHVFPFGRWTLFKSPFNRVPTMTPKSDVGPVQGELLLDEVKPVRNDLNESDLEVVMPLPKKAEEATATPPDLRAKAEDRMPATVWRRVVGQFAGAENP